MRYLLRPFRKFENLLRRLRRICIRPKAFLFLLLLCFDFRAVKAEYDRRFPNSFHPLQKKVEYELSARKEDGVRARLIDFSNCSVVDEIYSEWKDIINLFDKGFFDLFKDYIKSNYYLNKKKEHGVLLSKLKVSEFYALFLSMRNGYVVHDNNSDMPAIFLDGFKCMVLDGAHRLAISKHLNYNIPLVVFDFSLSSQVLSDESIVVLKEIIQ